MTPAEALLQELGITEPEEIDLETIAYHVGARVRFRPLCGCEAHILGCGGHAIITVKHDSSARRKRFSIAHELGHWRFHRGKTLVCRVDEYRPRDAQSPEKAADGYAADLLMPRYLFAPRASALGRIAFDSIGRVAEAFKTSLSVTVLVTQARASFPRRYALGGAVALLCIAYVTARTSEMVDASTSTSRSSRNATSASIFG